MRVKIFTKERHEQWQKERGRMRLCIAASLSKSWGPGAPTGVKTNNTNQRIWRQLASPFPRSPAEQNSPWRRVMSVCQEKFPKSLPPPPPASQPQIQREAPPLLSRLFLHPSASSLRSLAAAAARLGRTESHRETEQR